MKFIAVCGLLWAGFFSEAQASDPFADYVLSCNQNGCVNAACNNSNATLAGLTSEATVVYRGWSFTVALLSVGAGEALCHPEHQRSAASNGPEVVEFLC